MSEESKKREPEFDPVRVRDISVEVYKMRLIADSGKGSVERMIAEDGDSGERLRNVRACAYDPLTRCYMRAMGVK